MFEGTPTRTYSPIKDLEGNSQRASRTKMMSLLKRIAELELREGKYIEKIKYLEAVNMRLSCEHHQQLQLMSRHPTSEIQELIKVLQEQARKVSAKSDETVEYNKEKELWFKRYHELLDSSTKNLQEEKQKRIQLDYENKYLKNKITDIEKANVQSTRDSSLIKRLQQEKQDLVKQNQQLKKRKSDLQNQYVKLQSQIQSKFAFLEEQISLYQTQKAQNIDKIKTLKEELSIRESHHYFSFSNKNDVNYADGQCQTEEQQDYDINIYKSSIDSLLEQNARLKRSLLLLQSLGFNGQTLPKQVQIQYQLSRQRASEI